MSWFVQAWITHTFPGWCEVHKPHLKYLEWESGQVICQVKIKVFLPKWRKIDVDQAKITDNPFREGKLAGKEVLSIRNEGIEEGRGEVIELCIVFLILNLTPVLKHLIFHFSIKLACKWGIPYTANFESTFAANA